ncbi:MAG: EAL and HDOD domain-containing protein [Gemmatimonadota bacterium]
MPQHQQLSTVSSADEPSPCYDVFLARQPIFDVSGSVVAYELLYRRTSASTAADAESRDTMAAEVLVNGFLNIGIDQVTGGTRAYLNFTREMLLGGVYGLLDPTRVVIEILETVEPDEDVVVAVETMVSNGYTVALDDFEYHPRYDQLLGLVQVVKLDVLNRTAAEIAAIASQLSQFPVALLAERVETRDVHEACLAAGCRYFQGYYFQRPETLTKSELSASQLTILQLLNLLRREGISDRALEDAFRGDVSLTVKLLRTVNSAAMGGRNIESIGHAVRLVGRSELHKWLSLLLVTTVATRGGTDVELVRNALTRARFCEAIALEARDRRTAESLFMVGLFSLLDALLRMPLGGILERLDLADEVRRALLLRSGPFASTLSLVESYERASWGVVSAEAASLDLDSALLGELYLESVKWTTDRMHSVS